MFLRPLWGASRAIWGGFWFPWGFQKKGHFLVSPNKARHLEADAYHEMMKDPSAVVIDVRNHYESVIGHFKPPPGGATFLDPKMRNSRDFPKWLAQDKVQEQLKGKKVMMFCTGGIRCERFSALLTQVKNENPDFQTEGEFMVRGGIERCA